MGKSAKKFNGITYLYTEKDMTPEKVRKIKEVFKGIENIRIPMSGVELLEKIRKEHKIIPLEP